MLRLQVHAEAKLTSCSSHLEVMLRPSSDHHEIALRFSYTSLLNCFRTGVRIAAWTRSHCLLVLRTLMCIASSIVRRFGARSSKGFESSSESATFHPITLLPACFSFVRAALLKFRCLSVPEFRGQKWPSHFLFNIQGAVFGRLKLGPRGWFFFFLRVGVFVPARGVFFFRPVVFHGCTKEQH